MEFLFYVFSTIFILLFAVFVYQFYQFTLLIITYLRVGVQKIDRVASAIMQLTETFDRSKENIISSIIERSKDEILNSIIKEMSKDNSALKKQIVKKIISASVRAMEKKENK